jgi:hypothetical protein
MRVMVKFAFPASVTFTETPYRLDNRHRARRAKNSGEQ